MCVRVRLSLSLSLSLSLYLSVSLWGGMCLSVCLSVCAPVCLHVIDKSMSVCLSVFSLSPSLFLCPTRPSTDTPTSPSLTSTIPEHQSRHAECVVLYQWRKTITKTKSPYQRKTKTASICRHRETRKKPKKTKKSHYQQKTKTAASAAIASGSQCSAD